MIILNDFTNPGKTKSEYPADWVATLIVWSKTNVTESMHGTIANMNMEENPLLYARLSL